MTATTAEKPARPVEIAERALAAIARRGEDAVWISVVPAEALMNDARDLERRHARGEPLPLYGQSFAVKDNIDVAGLPTTAACPALATTPARHATVVARLIQAGALCVGKTNLDQLATGLTGVRSPYGIPRNLFDERYVVGGSSSGSAVAVAAGLVDFALGTDTAGSGRVPAAFNNIVGLKPSRGIFSTAGVVPGLPVAGLRLHLQPDRRGRPARRRARARRRRRGSVFAAGGGRVCLHGRRASAPVPVRRAGGRGPGFSG